MKKFEYVASGVGYLRLKSTMTTDESTEEFKHYITNILNNDHHTFSFLYNSYAEAGYGKWIQKYRGCLDKIHADSGGLQIITRGSVIDDEIKTTIYKNQGQYADVGMCFDEIPLTVVGTSSKRGDVTNRFFDHSKFEECARQTGKNILQQILTYEDIGSECKPYVILQGNSVETFIRWYEIILDTIPHELHHRLGGLSVSGAALGNGQLEDIIRYMSVPFLPKISDETHLHILGVGAISRLIPLVSIIRSGLYDDIKISYDSTTHTMMADNGLYYKDHTLRRLGREFNNSYRECLAGINEVVDVGDDVKTFHKAMNMSMTAWVEEGNSSELFNKYKHGLFVSGVRAFMDDLNELCIDNDAYSKYTQVKGCANTFNTLSKVKTLSDFHHWDANVGKYVDSVRISDRPPVDILESIFS